MVDGKVSKLTRPISHYKWPLGSDEKLVLHLSKRNLFGYFTLHCTYSNVTQPRMFWGRNNTSLGKWSLAASLFDANDSWDRGALSWFPGAIFSASEQGWQRAAGGRAHPLYISFSRLASTTLFLTLSALLCTSRGAQVHVLTCSLILNVLVTIIFP